MIEPAQRGGDGEGVPFVLAPELAARGLKGVFARVRLEEGLLQVDGDRSGGFAVPVEAMERLRLGMGSGRRSGPELRVWSGGGSEPLLLRAARNQESYAPLMRRLVAAVIAEKGMAAVELGTTRRSAIGVAVYWTIQLALFLGMAIYFYRQGFWPFTLAFLVLALIAIPVFAQIRSTMLPRPLRAMEELEQVFPKFPTKPLKKRIG